MPIRPPNLDDRRYDDILREARALIPQYCPEWTNLSDADPGMTLVQLFAWMTEMIIFRLNQVPDKTYIHFLNFIGEDRRPALPAQVLLTFSAKSDRPAELPAFTRTSTRQREDNPALDYVSTEALTVHNARVARVMAVRGGQRPAVREVPFTLLGDNPSALQFGGGRGVDLFELDPTDYGPDAYTAFQYLYLAHEDLRIMGFPVAEGAPVGRLRIRRASQQTPDNLSIASMFVWEYPTSRGWTPVMIDREPEEQLGMAETAVVTNLPEVVPMQDFGLQDDYLPLPPPVAGERWWIRGRLDYERWLANRMLDDLDITWRDDRGGEERAINNWEVRANGRTLEFMLQDAPPIRGGWTVRLSLVDRGLAAGRNAYLPRYRWSYRRGEGWEEIPRDRVRVEGTQVILTGPFTDMSTDGYNLRAERIETVFLPGLVPELDLELTWVRPIEMMMAAGDDPRRLDRLFVDEGPWAPFQIAQMLPPMIGRKWYLGADLFENRRQAPVVVEIDLSFEMNGTPIPEPQELYLLQLTYRAEDNWRVVWSEDRVWTSFTFAQLDLARAAALRAAGDEDGAKAVEDAVKAAGTRTVRIVLDPKTNLRGLARHEVDARETAWLRFELVKSSLTGQDEKKVQHPIVPRIHAVRLGVEGGLGGAVGPDALGARTYEQPLPAPRVAGLDYRNLNRRLTRVVTRAGGRLSEFNPFFQFIDLREEHQALYLQFDRPLPAGSRHVVTFRCRGEAYLPEGVQVEWEVLEDRGFGRWGWRRLHAPGDGSSRPYQLSASGALHFALPEVPPVPADGFWLRARFVLPGGMRVEQLPALPPVVHVLLNTTSAVNLMTLRTERFSGMGVPNQVITLRRAPIFLHSLAGERSPFPSPDAWPDLRVWVDGEDGMEEWFPVSDAEMLTASKDDRVFLVDPVEGTLSFGNGIRGRMLPPGAANVIVDTYRMVPGARGNVAAGEIVLVDGYADQVKVENLLPASGGRDAESIEEIIRRAPGLLTSRDRAVTRADFATIATEASGEVARAWCEGGIDPDGNVEVVILPRRREGEQVPDPMLATGLRDHVQRYLKQRCLVNVHPRVRLAEFVTIDVSVTLRLRPNANLISVREEVQGWIEGFLDPYTGGLDRQGWPFGGTLYAQDFGRMVSDIPEVRHVVDVQIYDIAQNRYRPGAPGWEEGTGTQELSLGGRDLIVARRVRVRTEDVHE